MIDKKEANKFISQIVTDCAGARTEQDSLIKMMGRVRGGSRKGDEGGLSKKWYRYIERYRMSKWSCHRRPALGSCQAEGPAGVSGPVKRKWGGKGERLGTMWEDFKEYGWNIMMGYH